VSGWNGLVLFMNTSMLLLVAFCLYVKYKQCDLIKHKSSSSLIFSLTECCEQWWGR